MEDDRLKTRGAKYGGREVNMEVEMDGMAKWRV